MDFVIGTQRARLMAVLRGMARAHDADQDADALMLIGLAVGLELAAMHPETAARMMVELEPPLDIIDRWLRWVVDGDNRANPDLPIN